MPTSFAEIPPVNWSADHSCGPRATHPRRVRTRLIGCELAESSASSLVSYQTGRGEVLRLALAKGLELQAQQRMSVEPIREPTEIIFRLKPRPESAHDPPDRNAFTPKLVEANGEFGGNRVGKSADR